MATVTPSLVIVGLPNFFIEDDVASRWPERRLDCLREFLYAAEQCLTRCFVELQLFSCHKVMSFCFNVRCLADDAEDVVLAHDQVVFPVEFDFGPAVFGDEHFVAHF